MTGRSSTTGKTAGENDLECEARLLARYLIGQEPSPEMFERYARGHARVLAGKDLPREVALVRFVRRHPWSLGPLEAASGLLQPWGLLRGKLVVMAAVLEAAPDFADDFLPREHGRAALLLALTAQGLRAGFKLTVGLALYPLARRL